MEWHTETPWSGILSGQGASPCSGHPKTLSLVHQAVFLQTIGVGEALTAGGAAEGPAALMGSQMLPEVARILEGFDRAMSFVYQQDFSDQELDQVAEMYPQYARVADYARLIKQAHKALDIDPLQNTNRLLAPYSYAVNPH